MTALLAGIPIFREWGRMAAGAYAAGALAALWASRRRAGGRARVWVAAAVFTGAAVLPLALEAVWRANADPGSHAQSEALVTEEAARALTDVRNPYAAAYLHGSLAARPLGTQTHFPYMPGMLAFGLPRALDGRSPLADARVWFAATTVGVGALALRLAKGGVDPRLRAAQVLAVLPTGAAFMATGGDDLPVLALMLLSLALMGAARPGAAGFAAGAAAAMKQTAWPFLAFLVWAARDEHGRRARGRALASSMAIALPVVAPFVAWDPGAFFEDVFRFPLGLGDQPSAAATPTLGGTLVAAFPAAGGAITVALMTLVAGVSAFLLLRRPAASAAEAAGHAAMVLSLAILLAPAARLGYLIYPLNMFVWSRAFGSRVEAA